VPKNGKGRQESSQKDGWSRNGEGTSWAKPEAGEEVDGEPAVLDESNLTWLGRPELVRIK
jgi:hypothetical protein